MADEGRSVRRAVSFAVSFPEVHLRVEDIWPDDDAPENPTAEDVAELMRESGGVHWVATDWNLLANGIEIFGNHDASRAEVR